MASSFGYRKQLFDQQGGLCHWCKEPMVLERGPQRPSPDNLNPRLCTLEHLKDRFDAPSRGRGVAACYECNQLKNFQRQGQVPKEVHQARSRGEKIYLKPNHPTTEEN